MLVRYEMEDWLTARDAAEVIGVGVGTIHQWVKREHLPVKGHDAAGRQVFMYIDLLKAARKTRRNGLGLNRVA